VLDFFGPRRLASDLVADDFQQLRAHLAKGRGPVWLANEIQRIRCVFRYAYESGDLDAPVRFGPGFKKPSAKVLRANRQKNGPRMFQPEQARAVLDKATVNGKTMILLALNCGLGNTDLGLLPIRAVDLRRGILDFPRSKTATERVVPLWPETVAAIREVLKHRPEPTDQADAEMLFIRPRARDNYVGDRTGTRVHGEIRRALEKAKVKGRTTYDFRRTFQTVAEGGVPKLLGGVKRRRGKHLARSFAIGRYGPAYRGPRRPLRWGGPSGGHGL
jgi:integrase